jgi:hypothetical protein
MTGFLQVVAALVVLAGLVWAAFFLEPHWSNKTGLRFIARAQCLGSGDTPEGGWKEVRGSIEGDQVTLHARGLRAARLRGTYRIVSKSPEPPSGKVVYLLGGERRVILRMPASSRTADVIDQILG